MRTFTSDGFRVGSSSSTVTSSSSNQPNHIEYAGVKMNSVKKKYFYALRNMALSATVTVPSHINKSVLAHTFSVHMHRIKCTNFDSDEWFASDRINFTNPSKNWTNRYERMKFPIHSNGKQFLLLFVSSFSYTVLQHWSIHYTHTQNHQWILFPVCEQNSSLRCLIIFYIFCSY